MSVLFADLVGFTSVSERRDAEDTREFLSRYFDLCRRLIELYGGIVEKFIGDAVVAIWGAPIATEDDPERAVRAALELVAAVQALGEEGGDPGLRARAGVWSGEAAVTLGGPVEAMVAVIWEEDDATAAIMLYVETFGNPDHFGRIARRVARRKPILAIKGRKADVWSVGAGSHTAAALRDDALVDALLRHAGVMRFHNGEEVFDTAEFFEKQPLPLGRRVGIVSNSRGVATLAIDACGSRGLTVGRSLAIGSRAGPSDYATSLGELLTDQTIDAVMAYQIDVGGGDPQGVLIAVAEVADERGKPVVASVLGRDGQPVGRQGSPLPNFRFPGTCAAVLARAVERREWLSRALGQRPELDDVDVDAACGQVGAWFEDHAGVDSQEGGGWLSTPAEAPARHVRDPGRGERTLLGDHGGRVGSGRLRGIRPPQGRFPPALTCDRC